MNWSEHHCAVLDVLASSRAASQAAMTWLSGEYRSRCCLTSNWPFEWQPGLKLSEPWFPPLIPPSPPPPTSCSYNLLSSCLHIFITTLVLRIPMKVFLGLCFAQEPLCLPLFPDSVTTSSPWTCTTVVDAAWLSWVVGPLLHLPSIPPPPLLLTQHHSTPLLAPKVHSSVNTGQDTGRGSWGF